MAPNPVSSAPDERNDVYGKTRPVEELDSLKDEEQEAEEGS